MLQNNTPKETTKGYQIHLKLWLLLQFAIDVTINRADTPFPEMLKTHRHSLAWKSKIHLNFNDQTSIINPIKLSAVSRFSLIKAKRYRQIQLFIVGNFVRTQNKSFNFVLAYTKD